MVAMPTFQENVSEVNELDQELKENILGIIGADHFTSVSPEDFDEYMALGHYTCLEEGYLSESEFQAEQKKMTNEEALIASEVVIPDALAQLLKTNKELANRIAVSRNTSYDNQRFLIIE